MAIDIRDEKERESVKEGKERADSFLRRLRARRNLGK